MLLLKKKWLIYKQFIKLLFVGSASKNLSNLPAHSKKININSNKLKITKKKKKNYTTIKAFTTNFKFEIKLYLLGLSFNRFVFNFDKIFFILCIITNFILFLSTSKPRALFIGEYNDYYKNIFINASQKCNQLYYEESYRLPGIVTNIKQAKIYCFDHNILPFIKHLDCIFSFFCFPNSEILEEAQHFGIPIIGLVELEATDIKSITYPIVCKNTQNTIYFFANYFSKILNYKNLTMKLNNFKKNIWYYRPKPLFNSGITKKKLVLKRHVSWYAKVRLPLNLPLLYYRLVFTNFTTIFKKFSFFNINFFFLKENILKNLSLKFYFYKIWLKYNLKNIVKQKRFLLKQIILKKFSLTRLAVNELRKVGKMKLKLRTIIGWRTSRFLSRNLSNSKRNLLKKLNYQKKRVSLNKTLAKINLKRNFLLKMVTENKDEIKQKTIAKKLKSYDNEIKAAKSKFLQKDSPKKYVKKEFVLSQRQIMGEWAYKKSRLFRPSIIPKRRKRLKRLKFFWSLKWLFKLTKRHTPRRYLCQKKPRKLLLKKKTAIKKMMFYYYNYPLNRQLSKLLKYSNKKKNKINTDSTKNFINILESKLCIFVTRVRFSSNVYTSKRLITKGNILVNGKVIYNPDYILNSGDVVNLQHKYCKTFYETFLKFLKPRRVKRRRFFNKLKFRYKVGLYINRKKRRFFTYAYKKLKIFRLFRLYWEKKKLFKHYKKQIKRVKNLFAY